jgi:hypothetical protein
MDLAHTHLLLNHFPVIGTIIGGGLFVLSLAMNSNDLKRASLVVLLGISLISIPTYITGNGAQDAIKSVPGISKSLIETHEGAAFVALGFMEFTGAFAWLALWQFRRLARVPRWNLAVILLLTLVNLGLMARASNLGGEIRHVEIRTEQETTPGSINAASQPDPPVARSVGALMTEHQFMWATCETLHFIGLSLLLGVVFLVDLRVLGVIKGVSFASLHRLLPWAALGFGVNVITGMMFFVGIPNQYIHNTSFYWKIAMVMIAGVNAVYFTLLEEPWALGPKEDAPVRIKIAAASAMVLWIGVLYCGSMLPFLGNAF